MKLLVLLCAFFTACAQPSYLMSVEDVAVPLPEKPFVVKGKIKSDVLFHCNAQEYCVTIISIEPYFLNPTKQVVELPLLTCVFYVGDRQLSSHMASYLKLQPYGQTSTALRDFRPLENGQVNFVEVLCLVDLLFDEQK